jgi:hypothetical protein
MVDDISKAIRRQRERILADVTAVLRGLAETKALTKPCPGAPAAFRDGDLDPA